MGDKRDAYAQKLKGQIDQWNTDIDKLREKAGKMGADTKAEMQKQVEGLKAKRKELEEKLTPLQKAGGEAWEDLKGGTNQALKALGDAVAAAKSRFK